VWIPVRREQHKPGGISSESTANRPILAHLDKMFPDERGVSQSILESFTRIGTLDSMQPFPDPCIYERARRSSVPVAKERVNDGF
jgi:hypothetical protein